MSSVCTDSSFSICSDFHGIRFVFAFATRCVVTACDDRHERVTACHLPNWQTLLSRSRGGECRPSSIVRIDIPPDSLVIGLRKFHWFRVWRLTITIHVNKKKKKLNKFPRIRRNRLLANFFTDCRKYQNVASVSLISLV